MSGKTNALTAAPVDFLRTRNASSACLARRAAEAAPATEFVQSALKTGRWRKINVLFLEVRLVVNVSLLCI